MALVVLCAPATPFRDAAGKALEAAGHRVHCAAVPAAIMEAPRVREGEGPSRERPDCVLLDETATGGPAGLYAAALRLRGTGPTPIPTLGVIDRQEPDARAAALQVCDDVLSRPAHLVEVVARIESLLRRGAADDRAGRTEDPATGLRSRGYLDERVTEEWRRATRFSEPLAFLVAGLAGGLRASPRSERGLREVGGALRRSLRQIDVLGRFGSFEVAALLVNTHLAGALTCAERLKKELAQASSGDGGFILGLSFYPGKDVASASDLVRTAERALERARAEGPGSVCLIQHQSYLFGEG